ncbi:MAG: response regulator [Candidatus Falkowbacteria bacterium]
MEESRVAVIVDGDPVSRSYYEKVLEKYFTEVHKAKNDQEAQEIILSLESCQKNISLALVCRHAEDVAGKNICRLIRNKNPKSRIIAVTADVIRYKLENSIAEGFDGYLMKPSTIENILAFIPK